MKNNMNWRAAVGGALLAVAVPLSPLGPITAARAADPAPADPTNVHHFTVMRLEGHGGYSMTDDRILARLDDALDFWNAEAGDRATFVKPTEVGTFTSQVATCDDETTLRKDASAAFPDKHFDGNLNGDHLVVLFPASCRADGKGSAVGMVGPGIRSGGWLDVTIREGSDAPRLSFAFAHEIGHNLGLRHAWGRACWESQGCAPDEYANDYSQMGHTTDGGPRPLDSFERLQLGLQRDELTTLQLEAGRRTRSFDVDLTGIGASTGTRGLEVVDPVGGARYYLNFHNGLGREAGTHVTDPAYKGSEGRFYNKGVTVESVGTDPKNNKPVSVLLPVRYDDSDARNKVWRYGMVANDTFTSSGGSFTATVTAMDLNGTARLHVVLTNPNVALGEQTGTIAITAKGAVGSTISATTSGWVDASLSAVQWRDNGVVVASGPSYTIPAGSDGHSITAEVTGTRESFKDKTATSDPLVVGRNLLTDGTVYAIRSQANSLVLATPGTPTSSGTQVALQSVTGAPTTQQEWTVLANTDGSFRLKNAATGRCLDNTAASTRDGSKTIEWFCNGGSNQNWRLAGSGTGYTLVNVGSGKATTAAGDGTMSQLNPGTVFIFSAVS